MLTRRQLKILNIIHSAEVGIRADSIARFLGLSSRTIRNEIKEIHKTLQLEVIESSKTSGYRIVVEHYDKISQLLSQADSLEEENRKEILLPLLLKQDKQSIFDLAEQLYLSESSIYKDLHDLSDELERKYDIKLFEISHNEVQIINIEHKIREFLFRYLKDLSFQSTRKVNYFLENMFCVAIDESLYQKIQNVLENSIKIYQLKINEQNLRTLVSCLYLCILRNRQGHFLKKQRVKEENLQTYFLFLVQQELQEIREEDIVLLEPLTYTFRLGDHFVNELNDFTKLVFDEFANDVFEKYSIDIQESSLDSDSLLIHLEYMIRRLETHYELNNPLKSEIKKKYPFSYEIAMLMVPILFRYKKVYLKDDEIAYVAIYVEQFLERNPHKLNVLVISSERHSIKTKVNKWIESTFLNQINLVGCENSNFIKNINKEEVDLLIFVGTPMFVEDLESVQISPFPDLSDTIRIQEKLHKIMTNRRMHKVLSRYIKKEHIHFYGDNSIEEVLQKLVEQVSRNGSLEDKNKFIEDILSREKYYPTNLGDLFMIPHALMTYSNQNRIEIGILNKPIHYHGSHIRMMFLLCIQRKRDDQLNQIFQYFHQIASNHEYENRLAMSKDANEFLENIFNLKLIKN